MKEKERDMGVTEMKKPDIDLMGKLQSAVEVLDGTSGVIAEISASTRSKAKRALAGEAQTRCLETRDELRVLIATLEVSNLRLVGGRPQDESEDDEEEEEIERPRAEALLGLLEEILRGEVPCLESDKHARYVVTEDLHRRAKVAVRENAQGETHLRQDLIAHSEELGNELQELRKTNNVLTKQAAIVPGLREAFGMMVDKVVGKTAEQARVTGELGLAILQRNLVGPGRGKKR